MTSILICLAIVAAVVLAMLCTTNGADHSMECDL